MLSYNNYQSFLNNMGKNLSEIRKAQTNQIINITWTNDPTYKKGYILTKDGWEWVDVKYQYHFSQTISKDNVDFYIQFRPGVHYPMGSYILLPDDTGPELNLSQEELTNPFLQPVSERTQWWLIVDRDEQNVFPRYNVLKCNWEYKWVYGKELHSVFGVIRSAQSYTSGIWRAEKTITLDNIMATWIPNSYVVYGDSLKDIGLEDTRTIMHDQRFLLTTNELDPKVYQTTKIVELSPIGILKLTLKQDEYNPKRDNIKLMVCDYYTNMGDMTSEVLPDAGQVLDRNYVITELFLDENNELVNQSMVVNYTLQLGKKYYYQAILNNKDFVPCVWDIKLQDVQHEFTDSEIEYFEGLMKLVSYDGNTVEIRPSKAHSLIGKRFDLIASRDDGEYISSINLEVAE